MLEFCEKVLELNDEPQEVVYVVMFNNVNQITGYTELCRGSVNSCNTKISEMLKPVILSNSPKFMLVHNHPSGSERPSYFDQKITSEVDTICSIVDLKLLDHIIYADGHITSVKHLMEV